MMQVGLRHIQRMQAALLGEWTPPEGCVLWLSAAKSGPVSAGGTWADSSGAGNDATLYFDTHVDNVGAHFDGSDDYIYTPINANWTEGTILGWALPNDLNDRNLWVYTADDGLTTCSHQAAFITSGLTRGYIYDGTKVTLTGITEVSAHKWYHVAIAWTKNSNFVLYLNATLEDQAPIGTAWASGTKVLLGKNTKVSSFSHNFCGAMDEIMIFNRALTEAEIQDIYNHTLKS